MKKILALVIILFFYGCDKDDEIETTEIDTSPLVHAELNFELDEPDIILNDIAKGSFDNNIQNVLRQMFDNFPEPAERYWEFEYLENSDKISKMIYYTPHYSDCEKNVYVFQYNSQNFVQSVISTRTNLCLDFEVVRTYTFNYNINGLLKSIFMDNDYFIETTYFGYYSNGKIKDIYSDFRGRGFEVNFNHRKFYYDSSFSNIVRMESTNGSTGNTIEFEYYYDNKTNPFKDFFISMSVFMPYIGPAYLSENNVIKIIERNDNANWSEKTNEFLFNYSNSDSLESFSDMDENSFPFILYSTNQ